MSKIIANKRTDVRREMEVLNVGKNTMTFVEETGISC